MTGAHANEVPRRGWGGQDGKPPWDLVLHVDRCFRKHAAYVQATTDDLRRIRVLWASAADVLKDLSQSDKS